MVKMSRDSILACLNWSHQKSACNNIKNLHTDKKFLGETISFMGMKNNLWGQQKVYRQLKNLWAATKKNMGNIKICT